MQSPIWRGLVGVQSALIGPSRHWLQLPRPWTLPKHALRLFPRFPSYKPPSQTRSLIHNRTNIRMAAPLNNSKDPVERSQSPYQDPRTLGPKSKILASRTSNFHSTSLRTMVTNTVNKTALHPSGVQYVVLLCQLSLF